jgi:hypothetical protein
MKKQHLLLLAIPALLIACERPLTDGEAEIQASLGQYDDVGGITPVQVYTEDMIDADVPAENRISWYEATVPQGDNVSMVLLGVRGGLEHPALDDGQWLPEDEDEGFRAYLVGCMGPSYGDWEVDLNAPAELDVLRRDDGRVDVLARSDFGDEGFADLQINGIQ